MAPPPQHTLKLYYFGLRGRVEHIRQTLKAAGVPFEDVILDFEQWGPLKAEMPLGQVPVLEVDGVKIGESKAIARFVGEEFGLTAANNVDRARLDMIAEVVGEFIDSDGMKMWPRIVLGMVPGMMDKDGYFRDKCRPQVEKYASLLEKLLVEKGAPLFNGEKVTWVDIYAAEAFSKVVDYGEKDALEAFPHLLALIDRVHNIPEIKEHIYQRKPSPI